MTDEPSARLHAALVAAYRPYVEAKLGDRGLPPVSEAIAEGSAWLDTALSELLDLPATDQRRSPLELFQEAMRFPTEALAAAGVPPVSRDPVSESALPGDLYDLALASSQALGEDAWQAHLQWGANKAAQLRPLAVLVTRNLMDGSKVEAAGASRGYRVATVRRIDAVPEGAVVVFVDLEHPDADEAVRSAKGHAGRVVAYGPHVDDIAMVRAQALGADEAMPRSRFFRDPSAHFPAVV
ncbi:MAG TPA: hypothetical protein VMM81_06765 [Acidimicrobiia bacterium]|nr:hypothetical protein [Acidimicrobiia bacterium]